MHITLRPTINFRYSIPPTGGLYLHGDDEQGGDILIAFHPQHSADALDRLDSLIEVAAQLRDHYRLRVEAEAADMAAEEDGVRNEDRQVEQLERIAAA